MSPVVYGLGGKCPRDKCPGGYVLDLLQRDKNGDFGIDKPIVLHGVDKF